MAILNAPICRWSGGNLKRLSRVWFVLAILFSDRLDVLAQTEISKEYQIKAVFLFNFAQFVDWPTNVFPEAESPFIIGILGDDPFDAYLDETVHGENMDGHPLVVQRFHRVEDIKVCNILFISGSESKQMEQILSDLKGRNILTVGDIAGFSKEGGMVQFVTERNKIHIRINLEVAKNADLQISSKLLRLAEIVKSGKD